MAGLVELDGPKVLPIEYLRPEDFNLTSDPRHNEALRAAEAHRRVRYKLHEILQPGVKLSEIISSVETSTRVLLHGERNNGIGFPCGVSINNCAAHFSLNPGNKDIILQESDTLKIDFGTHANGRIMDSAFTVCFDPAYRQLLRATKEATERGLKVIGIDSPVCEIGREIAEVFKSFEIELNGKAVPIRAVTNLNGHAIEQFKIHGAFSIPPYNNRDTTKVTAGFAAVETFATTGQGYVYERGDCSHFMWDPKTSLGGKIHTAKNQQIFDIIKKEVGTLPFSPRHIDFYIPDSITGIKLLSLKHIVDPYPPLYDVENSKVAQFEHTVYLTETGKHILTRGDDY